MKPQRPSRGTSASMKVAQALRLQGRKTVPKPIRPSFLERLTTPVRSLLDRVNVLLDLVPGHRIVAYLLATGLLYGLVRLLFARLRLAKPQPPLKTIAEFNAMNRDTFDVCIVGAGPAGASCAYFLANSGKRVLLLEKHAFPRDKVCGDRVTPQAQRYLREMGILQEVLAEHKGRWAQTGGFVSPSGLSFVADYERDREFFVQRVILDEKIAEAAAMAGATLVTRCEVTSVVFSHRDTKLWTINCSNGREYKAHMLVGADGAHSRLARELGVITEPPNASAARCFIRGGTHHFAADKVMFLASGHLPGFLVVGHELEDYLNVALFRTPGSPIRAQALQGVFEDYLECDPFICEALGGNLDTTPTQICAMRTGGVAKSYGEHFLVVGEAAGHVDPLTGEGIQFGMEGARIAARVILRGLAQGDLSEDMLQSYHSKSRWIAWLVQHSPVVLDSAAAVIRRNGGDFTASWNSALSGGNSKMWFLRPDIGPTILLNAFRLFLLRQFSLPSPIKKLVMPRRKTKLPSLLRKKDTAPLS